MLENGGKTIWPTMVEIRVSVYVEYRPMPDCCMEAVYSAFIDACPKADICLPGIDSNQYFNTFVFNSRDIACYCLKKKAYVLTSNSDFLVYNIPGVVLLDHVGAAEGAPGQIEHIGRPQHQHGQPDGGDQGGQGGAEQGAQHHHNGESHPDAQIEGQGPPEAQPSGVGHGHDVVGARGGGGDHRVGEEGVPGKHGA